MRFDVCTRCVLLLAAVTLWSGCNNDPEVKKLINNLRDDDPEERHDAAKALENMGLRGAPAAETLGQCLQDEDALVRYRAAKALSKLGKAAKPSIANLGHALSTDGDPKVQYYCAKALDELADQEPAAVAVVTDDLIASLSRTDSKTTRYVVKALGKIGPDAQDALGQLEKLALTDPDEATRKAAESAVRNIKKKTAASPSQP